MDAFLRQRGYQHLLFISPSRDQVLNGAAKDSVVQLALASQGLNAWGIAALEKARDGKAAVPALLLAQCYWSAGDTKSARAPLLLAYIAYNTGNEAQAGEYLAAAEQRAGPNDPLLKAWRRFWKVGAAPEATQPAPPPADVNK